MSIARDISRQTRRSIIEVTSGNAGTNFTVSGGFSGSSLDVYLNGAKLIINSDYSLSGTTGIILDQAAENGDVIEFVTRNTSNVLNVIDTASIINEAVTFDKLSNSATESSNVTLRLVKAWVNFNGTFASSPYTLANGGIRSAFNVDSITDNGVGDYTVNFTTAMPDANYAAFAWGSLTNGVGAIPVIHQNGVTTNSTTAVRLRASEANSYVTTRDQINMCVAIIR